MRPIHVQACGRSSTKVDLVAPERRATVEAEIARTLEGTRLVGCEIVPVSVVSGEGVEALRARLFAHAPAVAHSAPKGRFRLAVDRSFSLTGVGTVITGTVLSGVVAVGDQVSVSPSGLSARVRSIRAQNRPTDCGRTGERCALNLAGHDITKDAIHRGDIVLNPALHAPTDRIDALLRVLGCEHKPINHWMPVRLDHAAAEVGTRIVLLKDDPIEPGDDSNARTEALERFVPVAQQVFASLAPAEDLAPFPDVLHALTEFETWYRETHQSPFWVLFENQMPETPLVDF